MSTQHAALIAQLQGIVDNAHRVLANFQRAMAGETDKGGDEFSNPVFVLAWGDKVFEAAGELKVVGPVLVALKTKAYKGTTDEYMDRLVERLTDDLLMDVSSPSRSTSPSANLARDAQNAATADLLRIIKSHRGF